jgi:hypothetical protein
MTSRSKQIAAVLILIGAARIASTYRVFSEGPDEAMHVGAGLDLFARHIYVVQWANPPLPRLVMAVAPWFGGMRFDPNIPNWGGQRASTIYGHGKYLTNLVRLRVGNLVFFIIAALAVSLLARGMLDETSALLALLLFTTQPVVLGYSGLATHDTAGTAGTAVALLAFLRWLRAPTLANASTLGLAYGFSALCKFSCIPFVPAACAGIGLVRLIRDPDLRRNAGKALRTLLVVPVVGFLTVWARYAFTVGKVGKLAHVPAPDFFIGINDLLDIEREGFLTFAYGHVTTTGHWWYFLFAFGVKTTLSLLIVFALGAWFAVRSHAHRWAYLEMTAATAAIMLVTFRSALNLGVRYVLPVYVPFTIAAAAAAMAMLRHSTVATRCAAALLIAWHLTASVVAHPDYFPYFNEIAAREPSRYLIDSNFDWGQDKLRLARFCRQRHITAMAHNLFGPARPEAVGLPREIEIDWSQPPRVPTAISETALVAPRMTNPNAFPWADHEPYVRVGKTIRVYGLR